MQCSGCNRVRFCDLETGCDRVRFSVVVGTIWLWNRTSGCNSDYFRERGRGSGNWGDKRVLGGEGWHGRGVVCKGE